MRYSADAMKSVNVFIFFIMRPASRHWLAELAAAAHVGDGVDDAAIEQRQAAR